MVRVAEKQVLERFHQTWKLRNPPVTEQFAFAGAPLRVNAALSVKRTLGVPFG